MKYDKEYYIDNITRLSHHLNEVIEHEKGQKVLSVFTACPSGGDENWDMMIGETISILFDNDDVLDINYRFVSRFYSTLRKKHMEDVESIVWTKRWMKSINKDIAYDEINAFEIFPQITDYYDYQDGIFEEVSPKQETFRDVMLCMKNGSKIHLHPGDAVDDGYTWVRLFDWDME